MLPTVGQTERPGGRVALAALVETQKSVIGVFLLKLKCPVTYFLRLPALPCGFVRIRRSCSIQNSTGLLSWRWPSTMVFVQSGSMRCEDRRRRLGCAVPMMVRKCRSTDLGEFERP